MPIGISFLHSAEKACRSEKQQGQNSREGIACTFPDFSICIDKWEDVSRRLTYFRICPYRRRKLIVVKSGWICYKKTDIAGRKGWCGMSEKDDAYTVKLRQLEQTIHQMQRDRQRDHESIRREIQRLRREYRRSEQQMQRGAKAGRSPAVTALSAVQLDYDRKLRRILQDELPEYLHSAGSDCTTDRAEAASLYGEYAMDFAAQAVRHAQLAALAALDLQMTCEEETADRSDSIKKTNNK